MRLTCTRSLPTSHEQLKIDRVRLFGIDSPPLEQIPVSDLEYLFVPSNFPGGCRPLGPRLGMDLSPAQ